MTLKTCHRLLLRKSLRMTSAARGEKEIPVLIASCITHNQGDMSRSMMVVEAQHVPTRSPDNQHFYTDHQSKISKALPSHLPLSRRIEPLYKTAAMVVVEPPLMLAEEVATSVDV
jgi:hypothetical protein